MNNINRVNLSKELINKYKKEHSEKKFWIKMKRAGTKLGVTPVYLVFLLYHSLMSKDIPIASKAPITGALGYFISFIDVMPDLTPILGYCDDVSVIIGALVLISTQVNKKIIQDARDSTRKIFVNITDEEFSCIDNFYKIKY